MKKMTNNELKNIRGGTNITGTIINALVSSLKTIHEIGQSLGSAIRRIKENSLCKI